MNRTSLELDKTILLYPKTTIQNIMINWNVHDLKGNSYSWSILIIQYEDSIKDSAIHLYNQLHANPYHLNLHGQTHVVTSMDRFIKHSLEIWPIRFIPTLTMILILFMRYGIL